jgi:hypothetical protein
MAKGKSGRIVIEIDPTLKEDLYVELKSHGLTLKDWFLEGVTSFLKNENQIHLAFDQADNKTTKRAS